MSDSPNQLIKFASRDALGISRRLFQHLKSLGYAITKRHRRRGAATQMATLAEANVHFFDTNWSHYAASQLNLDGSVHNPVGRNYVKIDEWSSAVLVEWWNGWICKGNVALGYCGSLVKHGG